MLLYIHKVFNYNLIKISIIFIICFLYASSLKAQSTTLYGVVKDSLQQPLVFITLIAKPTDKSKTMKYVITDDKGRYKLELQKNISYIISVSGMGFKAYDFTYIPLENFEKNIELVDDINQLDEVIIELPIVVKKDTIIYKTDKFTTGEERKLKDILKKLPGIEIDETGTITSNGKKVTHLLVENKSFFGGNSKLGIENIPANSVYKIEVIDDYNEISFLKGMTRNENMAMNIKLKEDKKNFVFGDVEAGKGNKNYYKAHANLFYYHPKLNINFIGGINNTGEKSFSYEDYKSIIGSPSSVFNINEFFTEKNTISQDIETTDVFKSKNKIGALNFTRTLNDKIDFSSYFIFLNSHNEDLKETNNQYLLPNSSYLEYVVNSGVRRKNLGIGKLNFKYTPNNKEEWSFKMLAKRTDNLDDKLILSIIGLDEKFIKSSTDIENYYVSGNLEWHKKISKKHAFSTSSNFIYDKKDSDAIWNTNRYILEGLISLQPAEVYRLKLLHQLQKKDFNGIFKHYWTINNFNILHTIIGNYYGSHQFYTKDSQLLEDQMTNDFEGYGFGNDLNFKLNDFYLGVYYNARVGKFEFAQSLFLHNYSWSINQSNFTEKNKWVLLPEFSLKIGSSSSYVGNIRLNYKLKSSFSDVSKLANNYYLQSYNSVHVGNDHLENELYHASSATYFKSDLYRGIYLFSKINYTKKINGIINSIVAINENSVFSYEMLSKPEESFAGTLIVEKRLKNFKYKIRTRLFSTKYTQKINSNISTYKNESASYRASVRTSHENFPIVELGFKQSFGNYSSSRSNYKFTTNEPFFSFDYDFLKKFIFSFDYTYYKYQNKSLNLTNSYSISNVSILYGKENSAWNFKLSANNLFDIKFKNQNSFDTYIISENKTSILPRIAMFSIIYKL